MKEVSERDSLQHLNAEVVGSSASSSDSLSSLSGTPPLARLVHSDDEGHPRKQTKYSKTGHQALSNLCINTVRFLCVDAINKANSGHPGICMGMAATAFVLFDNHLLFNPRNPTWPNRDRFVLSAGHGSMLLYALLHMFGYQSISLDDVKSFRKLGSRTPGHPECTQTPGVEVCTGPLGQGISNAVGIAISEQHMAAVYNRLGHQVVDNHTYCIAGDGCMMEGMAAEACSLAGHLQLGKLIVLYDDNHISIDGSTDLTFTEDVSMRMKSYGWQVLHVEDGNTDLSGIDDAIREAKACVDKPSLIKITTTIGYGSPNRANSATVHGSALGEDETKAGRIALGYEYEPFEIPPQVLEHCRRKTLMGALLENSWHEGLEQYRNSFPEQARKFQEQVMHGVIWPGVEEELQRVTISTSNKTQATRKHSSTMLNSIASNMSSLIGGAADTSPSTLTDIACSKDFTASNRMGRNIRFGVREHAMAAICNGISLAGYNLRPFCSTFFVFSDYMRAAMRMASLSQTGTIFITTHDSVGLGEDGPSHQPIEHLASFRAMPNHDVWRPADAVETGAAYSMALAARTRPTTLVLSRQSTPALECTAYENAKRGGYVVADESEGPCSPDGVIVATGTEVSVAVDAARQLCGEHGLCARVVSLPCWEEFERQTKDFKRSVFCLGREQTVSIEAASSFGWSRYADYHVCVDEFGFSAPGKDLFEHFGVTVEKLVSKFLDMRSAL